MGERNLDRDLRFLVLVVALMPLLVATELAVRVYELAGRVSRWRAARRG